MKLCNIKGIIFDWAGTMVDYGCIAPFITMDEVFGDLGVQIPQDVLREGMGKKKIDHIRQIASSKEFTEGFIKNTGRNVTEEDILEIYNNFEKKLMVNLDKYTDLIDGAENVLEVLRSNNIKIGSTSGYTKEMMEVVSARATSLGYTPDFVVASDEVEAGRPAPYMCYKNALELNMYPLNKAIKVGDTTVDVLEGKNAGMWTVAILYGGSELGVSRDDIKTLSDVELNSRVEAAKGRFREVNPDYIINSLEELPEVLAKIDERIGNGEVPNSRTKVESKLLTPGPLTTSYSTKVKMLKDSCTWDNEYKNITEEIRTKLVKIATNDVENYTSVLMQGSGSFGVEGTIGSAVPEEGTILVCANGAYGRRIIEICEANSIKYISYEEDDETILSPSKVEEILNVNTDITHVAFVHCETTTGILNPLEDMCKVVKENNKVCIVDAMSSFGGVPMDISELGIDFIISSANKCIEGVPGFSFILAKKTSMEAIKNIKRRSLSLNIYDQWATMEKDGGKWRFTSPTHVVLAFRQALVELEEEGGIEERYERYANNQRKIVKELAKLGIEAIIDEEKQSPIITSFLYPNSPNFKFSEFYKGLKLNGFTIYPGKLTNKDTFRIGNIGKVYNEDVDRLVEAIKNAI